MLEITTQAVDTGFLYFRTRRSSGDELAPFADEVGREPPHTYVWARDGCIGGSHDNTLTGSAVNCRTSAKRYWLCFRCSPTPPRSLRQPPRRWARSWRQRQPCECVRGPGACTFSDSSLSHLIVRASTWGMGRACGGDDARCGFFRADGAVRSLAAGNVVSGTRTAAAAYKRCVH
jgi:hypothetical protein